MKQNLQLTEHFNLEEFTRSATAAALGIDNLLHADHDTATMTNDHDRDVIENLRNLCTQVLEPLREFLGVPVIVTSGYRCPELNKAAGGVANSQHIVGKAADIAISDEGLAISNTNDERLAKAMIPNRQLNQIDKSRITNRVSIMIFRRSFVDTPL